MQSERTAIYDVVVVGGSLAGAAAAFLLLRARPGLRVAVVEKAARHSRRVGEATVEVSAYFLVHALGLAAHLNEHHITKQGMRFWFGDASAGNLAGCSEIGGRYLARVPAWQVDRSVLDEEVLRRAAAAGATILRPAKVLDVTLAAGGRQRVNVEDAGGRREIDARWVVDASGFTCLLARRQGWFRRNEDHPTTAVWTRWRGVADLDGPELAARHPEWALACRGLRSSATNHVMGDGWWAWCIPLKGGDYSVGAVFDQRRVRFPEGPSVAARLRAFLDRHPAARELLRDAEPVEGDSHWRSHLPYCSERFAGDGFVIVGDAGAFIDPFYSPGMDWLAYSVTRGVETILAGLDGCPLEALLAAHNDDFAGSYRRWFDAVYRDKYDVFGDFELMVHAFRLDLAMYYAGVVSQPLERGVAALRDPVFSLGPSRIPYRIMRLYNRRLARMGRDRRRRGVLGRKNVGHRYLFNGYLPERSTGGAIVKSLLAYALLELREGWRTWFHDEQASAPAAAGRRPGKIPQGATAAP